MANCASCGHWAGPADEPCPHCGVGAKAKRNHGEPSPAVPAHLRSLPTAKPTAGPSARGASPENVKKWYQALNQSPVFASADAAPAGAAAAAAAASLIDDDDLLIDDDDAAAAPIAKPISPRISARGSLVARALQQRGTRDPARAEPTVEPTAQPTSLPTVQPVLKPNARPVARPLPIVAPVPVLAPIAPADGPLVLSPIVSNTAATSEAATDDMDTIDDAGNSADQIDTMQDVGDPVAFDMALVSAFEHASVPGDDDAMEHFLITLSPAGPPALDPAAGPVAHVILALDISGSMNQTDKYPLLTEALANMLYDLKRPDTADVLLSVVVFAYGAEIILRDVPASQLDPREVLRMIDRSPLRFGRYTDAVGALSRAGRIAYDSAQLSRSMPIRIFLLTDGRPQDMDGARKVMEKIRKLPVDVDGLAFGADADVGALQELTAGGRGGTVKQIRPDTISDAFGHIAEAAVTVVANRAVLQVELAAGVIGGAAWRWRPGRTRFGKNAFEPGNVFKTDLGTLESGRDYSLLFQVRLPLTTAAESEVARVVLHVPTREGPRVFEAFLSVPRHAGAAVTTADRDVEIARDVLHALGNNDPKDQLKALRIRRQLYCDERRDPEIIAALDRAIDEIEQKGSMSALSAADQAAIMSHTCTVGAMKLPKANRELSV